MNPRRAPTIRARLALLVVASAAPAVLLAAALLVIGHGAERERLVGGSVDTARAMVHSIDAELVSLTTAAEVLATSRRLEAGDIAGFREQAEQVVRRGIAENVVVSGADGRQLLNTLRPAGETLAMHGNPEQLARVFATGRPVVSNLYRGGVLRRPVVSVDVPVFRDRKVMYDLSVGALPARFHAILGAQQLPAGWIGAVFDANGTIVARTHEQDRFVGSRGAPELVAAMARAPEGSLETVTLEGIPVISAYSRSPTSGWSVALGIPRESIAKPLRERSAAVAAALAVVLAIALMLSYAIGGRIAESVRALVKPAGDIGRHETIEIPPLGLREADEVGEALARAARLIALAEHRAQHDPLTGLANRALFMELAAYNVEAAKRNATPLSVLFIDLDGFKQVNDNLGHDAGDQLLCAVAERLRGAARRSDVAARVGGDEFAMLTLGVDANGSVALAAKISDALAEPFEIAGHTVRISASVGTASYPESGATAHDLLNRADEAMYRRKSAKPGVTT